MVLPWSLFEGSVQQMWSKSVCTQTHISLMHPMNQVSRLTTNWQVQAYVQNNIYPWMMTMRLLKFHIITSFIGSKSRQSISSIFYWLHHPTHQQHRTNGDAQWWSQWDNNISSWKLSVVAVELLHYSIFIQPHSQSPVFNKHFQWDGTLLMADKIKPIVLII